MDARNSTRRCQRKTGDFTLSLRLSERVDLYLQTFWPLLPGASRHDGLWPSNKGGPMSANAIYDKVCKRTETAFGFRVNPHRFRHAAGTLWSIADPENVRGVKDLLGHASFDKTTEAHYIHNQSVADRWPGIGKGDRSRDCLATGGQIALHGSPNSSRGSHAPAGHRNRPGQMGSKPKSAQSRRLNACAERPQNVRSWRSLRKISAELE